MASALRGRGWDCVLVARNEERLRPLAEELGAEWELCDVGDREAVERTAAAIVERHPRVSLLVNNAGVPGRGGFLRTHAGADRGGDAHELPRRRLVPARLPAGARGGRALRRRRTWSRSRARWPRARPARTRPRSTPSSRSRARCRRSCGRAGSACTRSCPGSSRPRASRSASASARGSARCGRAGARGGAAGRRVEQNRREVFVPRWYRIAPLAQALAPGLVARVAARGNPARGGLGFRHGRLDLPPPRPSTVAEFRAALRGFLRTSERNARAAGLTPQRYLLLLMIKGAPDESEQSTVTELAERLQLAQSTVTELVSRAEEIGLVERERSSDDGRIAHPAPDRRRRAAPGRCSRATPASATGAEPGVRAPPGHRPAYVGSRRARRDPLLPHLKRLRREGRESRDRAHRRRLRGRGDPR